MRRFLIESLGYLVFVIGLILVVGGSFTRCQCSPAYADQPRVAPESYFQHPEPCKEQRKKECEVKR